MPNHLIEAGGMKILALAADHDSDLYGDVFVIQQGAHRFLVNVDQGGHTGWLCVRGRLTSVSAAPFHEDHVEKLDLRKFPHKHSVHVEVQFAYNCPILRRSPALLPYPPDAVPVRVTIGAHAGSTALITKTILGAWPQGDLPGENTIQLTMGGLGPPGQRQVEGAIYSLAMVPQEVARQLHGDVPIHTLLQLQVYLRWVRQSQFFEREVMMEYRVGEAALTPLAEETVQRLVDSSEQEAWVGALQCGISATLGFPVRPLWVSSRQVRS